LATFLTTMSNTTYESYFKWKRKYISRETTDELMCKLCQKLNKRYKLPLGTVLAKRTFQQWWYMDGKCRSWSRKNLFTQLFSSSI
jgi:hypothetical protein